MTVLAVTRPSALPGPGWFLMPVQLLAVVAALLWPAGAPAAVTGGAAVAVLYVLARRRFWAAQSLS